MDITSRSSTAVPLIVLAFASLGAIRPAASHANEIAGAANHPLHSDSLYSKSALAREGDTLSLHLVSRGSVSIRGWTESRVDMNARLGGDATSRAIEFGRVGETVALTLDTPDHRPGSSARYALGLQVPRQMNISLNSANGSVTIDDVPTGDKRVHLGNGDITVVGAATGGEFVTGKGDIVLTAIGGDVTASTSRGMVKLDDVHGNVVARSTAGNVHIVVAGISDSSRSISVFAARGSVVVELPAAFSATLDLESVSESGRSAPIESDWPLSTTTGSRADVPHQRESRFEHATAAIGAGGMRVTIRTSGGSITVRRARN